MVVYVKQYKLSDHHQTLSDHKQALLEHKQTLNAAGSMS